MPGHGQLVPGLVPTFSVRGAGRPGKSPSGIDLRLAPFPRRCFVRRQGGHLNCEYRRNYGHALPVRTDREGANNHRRNYEQADIGRKSKRITNNKDVRHVHDLLLVATCQHNLTSLNMNRRSDGCFGADTVFLEFRRRTRRRLPLPGTALLGFRRRVRRRGLLPLPGTTALRCLKHTRYTPIKHKTKICWIGWTCVTCVICMELTERLCDMFSFGSLGLNSKLNLGLPFRSWT
jgi:hypothetical protein